MTSQDKSPDDLNSITKDDLNSITTRTDYSRILIVRATFCCFQKKYTCIPGASNVHKAHSYVAKYVKYRRIVCMTICLPLLVPCLPPCSWSSSSLLLIALLSPYCLLPLIPRILPECQPNVVILRAEIPRTVQIHNIPPSGHKSVNTYSRQLSDVERIYMDSCTNMGKSLVKLVWDVVRTWRDIGPCSRYIFGRVCFSYAEKKCTPVYVYMSHVLMVRLSSIIIKKQNVSCQRISSILCKASHSFFLPCISFIEL